MTSSYLLVFVLGHVGLELEVAAEFAAAELALVRAVDLDELLVLNPGGSFRLGLIRNAVTVLFFVCVGMLSRVLGDRFHRDGESGHGAVHSGRPHLVRLHVLLHVGFLGEGSAAHDALERLLARMTAAQNVKKTRRKNKSS